LFEEGILLPARTNMSSKSPKASVNSCGVHGRLE
jgi:hypothetical protein